LADVPGSFCVAKGGEIWYTIGCGSMKVKLDENLGQ